MDRPQDQPPPAPTDVPFVVVQGQKGLSAIDVWFEKTIREFSTLWYRKLGGVDTFGHVVNEDEVAQATMKAVWKANLRFAHLSEEERRKFLFGFCHRCALNVLDKQKQKVRTRGTSEHLDTMKLADTNHPADARAPADVENEVVIPDDLALRLELAELKPYLEVLKAELSAEHYAVFVHHVILQQRVTVVATAFGVSSANVYTIKSRGMKRIVQIRQERRNTT